MLGTYSTYRGQLEVLRSVIGLHVGNLQHLDGASLRFLGRVIGLHVGNLRHL